MRDVGMYHLSRGYSPYRMSYRQKVFIRSPTALHSSLFAIKSLSNQVDKLVFSIVKTPILLYCISYMTYLDSSLLSLHIWNSESPTKYTSSMQMLWRDLDGMYIFGRACGHVLLTIIDKDGNRAGYRIPIFWPAGWQVLSRLAVLWLACLKNMWTTSQTFVPSSQPSRIRNW